MTTASLAATTRVPRAACHPAPRDPAVNGFGPEPSAGSWPNRPRLVAAPVVRTDGQLPEPGPWCGALARAAVEIALGGRPAVQLVRWLLPEVYDRLAARAGLQSRIRGNQASIRSTRVRAVRLCELDDKHIEAVAAVWDGRRVRAVAIRLEARRARWLAVELVIM